MITKKFYLSLVVFISLAIFGSGMVEAMQMYGQPPMQPYGSQSSKAMERQQKIAKLQAKKMKKPHKAAKYDKKIMEHQQKMAMGR